MINAHAARLPYYRRRRAPAWLRTATIVATSVTHPRARTTGKANNEAGVAVDVFGIGLRRPARAARRCSPVDQLMVAAVDRAVFNIELEWQGSRRAA
jgi:hypothetical protein